MLGPALKKFSGTQIQVPNSVRNPLERVYLPADPDEDDPERIGFPGAVSRSRAACSRRCTAAGCGRCASTPAIATAEESNARYRFLLAQGQTGLSVAFDLPTQIGYDPDHPLAAGEVGQVGVSIFSLEEMQRLFAGIPLEKVSTSMTINAPGGGPAGDVRRRGQTAGRGLRPAARARSRTTSSRNTSPAGPTSSRPRPRCAW